MRKTCIFAFVLSVILAFSSLSLNAEAAEQRNTVYISTQSVSSEATEYAHDIFSNISETEFKYLGLSESDAKSAVISDGFIAENLTENSESSYIFYYPVVSNGKISAMMTVTYNSGKYGFQLGKDTMAENLNNLKTSYDSPAKIYVSPNAFYAATSEGTFVLSYGLEYSLKSIEKETAKADALYKSNGYQDEQIVAYGNANGKLTKIKDKIYFIEANGKYAVGWQTVDGKQYYFRQDGSAVVKNTVINGIRYRFDENGVCKGKYSGWVKKSDKYYYYKNGEIKKNCWLKVNGKRTYYLTSDGSMAVGNIKISGKAYSFDKNGKLKNS